MVKGVLQRWSDSIDERSWASRLRRRRFVLFRRLASACSTRPISVLDVGGWERFWEIQDISGLDLRITLLNLAPMTTRLPNISSVTGDARDLSRYPDRSFDIVFSNSVIEHLMTAEDQRRMASEVARVARSYYIQTPSAYFPIEPHFLVPFFHWLPVSLRVRLVQRFALGWYPRLRDRAEASAAVNEIRLLRKGEFASLFPDAEIHTERLFGWTKSYIAVR